MVNLDVVIRNIMKYGRSLVNADRASLFLIDHKNEELYASVFDLGADLDGNDTSEIR